jgi:hypothetical protein
MMAMVFALFYSDCTHHYLLPNSEVHLVEGAGHASTCGSQMDMAAILITRFSELQKPKPKDNKEGSGSSSKDNKNKSTATVVATKKRPTMKPEAAQGIADGGSTGSSGTK